MPSAQERRKATQRRAIKKQRKRIGVLHRVQQAAQRARANIEKRRKLIRQGSGTPGVKAVRYLLGFVGKTEVPFGSNDAPFLRDWEDRLGHDRLDWMIPGQPWCGLAAIAGWKYGAGKLLPDDTVSTIAIANRAARNDGYRAVGFGEIKPGDLVVFDFNSGGPQHVGLAVGPAKGGVVKCVEGNTSFDDAGSQANGGAVALRNRALGLVHTVARPT